MKKLNTFSIAILLFIIFSTAVTAQTGMPQYNMRCEREGTFIGNIKVELFRIITPLHVHNFDSLVSIHFYDTTAFHRVVPNFVIQGGDPNSRHGDPSTWGEGDPTQTTVPAEFTNINHDRGIFGAARDSDINSATSQFFINVVENSGLNGAYTAYGRVYEGMDVADNIVNSPVVPGTERPVQKIEMFVTYIGDNHSIPDIPTLVSPQDGLEDVISQQVFEWTIVPDAVLNRFQVSTDSNFTTFVIDTLVGDSDFTLRSFEMGFVKHYWRVQSTNGGNFSDFSEVRTFTTAIDMPNPITPPDSAENVSVNPIFEWTSVEGAISYRLQIATNTFFVVGIVLNQPDIVNTSYSFTGLDPDKKYFWRVKGVTADYEGLYSEIYSFTTAPATTVDDNIKNVSFGLEQNYPNPFNPVTSIAYRLAERRFVTLKIYDPLGNLIKTLVSKEQPEGLYNVKFDGADIPTGTYFYRLTAGSFTRTKKLLLLK